MRRHISKVMLAPAVLAVAACSSGPTRVAEVEQARAAVQQVESSPDAGRYAAAEITAAHDALREAEATKSKADKREQAYLAQRHADTAAQQIARGQAEEQTKRAEADRQRVLLQAREQEAAAARAQAEQQAAAARAQAEQTAAAAEREKAALEQQLRDLQAKQTERGLVLTLGDVLFDTGQATLKPGAMSTIDRLGGFLQQSPERTVIIEGHTDSVGADGYNQTLSENRAESVKTALVSRGVPPERVRAVGKGESAPVASNDNAAGRQQNRRVEIIISNPVEVAARQE